MDFKIGDRVKIIDADGYGSGRVGDIGVATNVDRNLGAPLLDVVLETGIHAGLKSRRYSYRHKLASLDWDSEENK